MSQPLKVLIHSDMSEHLAARLSDAQSGVHVATCGTYEGLGGLVSSFRPDVAYSICFAGRAGFPRDALLGPHGPKWISVGGSGVDHLGRWDPTQVTVTNSSGVAAGMMAEYVFGAFLHFSLDLPGLETDRKAKRWAARGMAPLAGKTLLIVGLGHTGKAVAERAQAFGMRVIGTRAHPARMENVDEVHAPKRLADLVATADFIVISTPLLSSTRGMINAQVLARAKPEAVLVDVSRGGVVDPDALFDALSERRIKGAALDVFPTEPLPEDDRMWSLENVIISPHCSSVFDEWEDRSFDLFLANLTRWRNGEALLNIVDPARGY